MEKAIDRLFKYLKNKDLKHTRFEKEIGLSNGYLNTQLKRNANLGEEVLNKIIDNCLDLNPIWLLTGKGKMKKEQSVANEQFCTLCVQKDETIGALNEALAISKEALDATKGERDILREQLQQLQPDESNRDEKDLKSPPTSSGKAQTA